MRLTTKQREYVAKYLIDISKLAFAGMVISKFVSPNPVPAWVLVMGIALSVATLVMAVIIDKGDRQ